MTNSVQFSWLVFTLVKRYSQTSSLNAFDSTEVVQKKNGASLKVTRLSLSYTTMATNADQRKWRQTRGHLAAFVRSRRLNKPNNNPNAQNNRAATHRGSRELLPFRKHVLCTRAMYCSVPDRTTTALSPGTFISRLPGAGRWKSLGMWLTTQSCRYKMSSFFGTPRVPGRATWLMSCESPSNDLWANANLKASIVLW